MSDWIDLGLAVTCTAGQFGVISGVCNHVSGPLGEGRLDGEYVVCAWHIIRTSACPSSSLFMRRY